MMRRMLKLAGIGLVLVVFAFVALFVSLGMASRKTQQAANAIKSGVTIEQLVQNFPRNSDMAILQREENAACDSSAALSAREPATPRTEAPKFEGRKATDRQSVSQSNARDSEDCALLHHYLSLGPRRAGVKSTSAPSPRDGNYIGTCCQTPSL